MKPWLGLLPLLIATPAVAEDYLVTAVSGAQPLPIIARVRDGVLIPLTEDENYKPELLADVFQGHYQLFGLDGLAGAFASGAPISDEYVGSALDIPDNWKPQDRDLLASSVPGASAPSLLKEEDTKAPALLQAVQAILVSQGLLDSPTNIWHAVRTDLESDGVEEIIIAGSIFRGKPIKFDYEEEGRSKPGDYVVLAVLRDAETGGYEIQWSQVWIPKGHGFEIDIFAIADVTGDGVAELAAYARGYEWHNWVVYQWDGKALNHAVDAWFVW